MYSSKARAQLKLGAPKEIVNNFSRELLCSRRFRIASTFILGAVATTLLVNPYDIRNEGPFTAYKRLRTGDDEAKSGKVRVEVYPGANGDSTAIVNLNDLAYECDGIWVEYQKIMKGNNSIEAFVLGLGQQYPQEDDCKQGNYSKCYNPSVYEYINFMGEESGNEDGIRSHLKIIRNIRNNDVIKKLNDLGIRIVYDRPPEEAVYVHFRGRHNLFILCGNDFLEPNEILIQQKYKEREEVLSSDGIKYEEEDPAHMTWED